MKNISILVFLNFLCFSSSAFCSVEDGLTAYSKKNYTLAVKEFEKSSDRGDVQAIHYLASMYYQGYGVKKNLAKSAALFIVKLLYYSYKIRKKLEITHRLSRSTILYAYV